jgi:hypothetical protein
LNLTPSDQGDKDLSIADPDNSKDLATDLS